MNSKLLNLPKVAMMSGWFSGTKPYKMPGILQEELLRLKLKKGIVTNLLHSKISYLPLGRT